MPSATTAYGYLHRFPRLAHPSALAWVCLLLVQPAAAQTGSKGQVELGAYGTVTAYDGTTLGLNQDRGAGGRLGVFATRVVSLEASGDYTIAQLAATGEEVNLARLGGTLYANAQILGSTALYLGAGYERTYYRGAYDTEDSGGHLIFGARMPLGGRAALRAEARGSYVPSSTVPGATTNAFNFGGALGVSIFAFGGPKRDTDQDGVQDKNDECPGTPFGALVDQTGCPTDEDQDRVFDGLDQCPGTPLGATVDPVGCPTDSDADGVLDGIDVCPETPAGALVDANGCPSDSDGDRVFDGLDQCPDTPLGATVDAVGCPIDTDGDSVFDGIDMCPDTPPDTMVDERGCPADADGDGVTDALDQCPDTPRGTAVDEVGCRADADGDGVHDLADRCPNTTPGQRVDAVGCPVLFEIVEGQARPLVLKGVNFQVGRSALTPES